MSAKTGENIEEAFKAFSAQILQKQKYLMQNASEDFKDNQSVKLTSDFESRQLSKVTRDTKQKGNYDKDDKPEND